MSDPVLPAAQAQRVEEEWGSLCWLASSSIGQVDRMTVGRVSIRAGRANPRHFHPNCDEVLYLLKGRLEHTLGDRTMVLNAGDTLIIRTGEVHNARNVGGEDADMIVVYNAGERQFKLEEPGAGR